MRNARLTRLAALALAVTAVAVWLTNGAVSPGEATWEDVVAEAKDGGYHLISTDHLWKKYTEERDRLLIVDTRQQWEYRTGHIKAAVNFPMEPTRFARWKNKGSLAALLGTDKDRPIVFY